MTRTFSRKLVVRLAELFPDPVSVAQADLLESPDLEIWQLRLRTRHNNRAASQGSVAPVLDAPDKGRGATPAPRGHPDHRIRGRSRTRHPGSGPRLTAAAPTDARSQGDLPFLIGPDGSGRSAGGRFPSDRPSAQRTDSTSRSDAVTVERILRGPARVLQFPPEPKTKPFLYEIADRKYCLRKVILPTMHDLGKKRLS